jgi:hypothetical protein
MLSSQNRYSNLVVEDSDSNVVNSDMISRGPQETELGAQEVCLRACSVIGCV